MSEVKSKKSQLPSRFFGNKIFLQEHYDKLQQCGFDEREVKRVVEELFQEEEEKQGEHLSNYLVLVVGLGVQKGFCFQKLSCLVELGAHVLQQSMQGRLDVTRSFNLFKDCLVRHSLFRPPYCVLIYSLQEIKDITSFFQNTFFKHYLLYLKTFTNEVNIEINTFQMFKSEFMKVEELRNEVDKNSVKEIREYLVDKAIGLTEQELEEIMKGDSIHQVPLAKRLEWQRLREERLRQAKIDNNLQQQIQALHTRFQQKLEEQDKAFQARLEVKAPPPKKK